jgi:hypothetical protein
MEYLVGYTGFVGSNIAEKHKFDGNFNTKNIEKAYGGEPDLLVYAGVRAEMYLANQNPDADRTLMDEAIENIKRIAPKKIVLISTIAVYHDPDQVDESCDIDETTLTAYGANRLYLERWVENHIPDHLIVRLPGLYGKNLKKNFIYDYIHYIPQMLSEEKYRELSKDAMIQNHYIRQENGFYKCDAAPGNVSEWERLKEAFRQAGFSALQFTDSRGVFQYYNLEHLWDDIEKALNEKIPKLNLAVEPVTIAELYRYLTGENFENELPKPVPHFNFKTKYDKLWNGKDGYICSKEQVLADVRRFIGDCK